MTTRAVYLAISGIWAGLGTPLSPLLPNFYAHPPWSRVLLCSDTARVFGTAINSAAPPPSGWDGDCEAIGWPFPRGGQGHKDGQSGYWVIRNLAGIGCANVVRVHMMVLPDAWPPVMSVHYAWLMIRVYCSTVLRSVDFTTRE